MKVGVVGCGAIGLGCAALLHTRNHAVAVWAPREGPAPDTVVAEGAVVSELRPLVARSAAELAAHAEVLLIAVPANGHAAVVDALAPVVTGGQAVWWTPVASGSALLLHEAAKARGVELLSLASPTTVVTGRRTAPGRVRVATVRDRLAVAPLPVARAEAALVLARALFGDRFDRLPDVLAASLAPINPVAHVPLMLANLTRAELGERWGVYRHMTPATSRVIEQLDAERVAVARGCGYDLATIHDHFVRSFGVAPGPLASIAREIVAKRNGGPDAPASLDTRFISEDAPYGLRFTQALGALAGVATPATDAALTLAAAVFGADVVTRNPVLERLLRSDETVAQLRLRAQG